MMTLKDVENLNIPQCFGIDEDSIETSDVEYVIEQVEEAGSTCVWGASKFVIFVDDENIVVKIPFNSKLHYDYNTLEPLEEGEDGCLYEMIPNYCEKESCVYKDAEVAGIPYFFAKTEFAGYTDDWTPYYISERVVPFDWAKNGKTRVNTKERQQIYAYACKVSSLNESWINTACDFYGEDAVSRLISFIEEEGINDLYEYNIGFRKDGSPCIFDYSGYGN